ncbi:MAG: DNA polymerase III subunit beta [Verrucomicrobiales bacterium]|nr:DNA polymerase III subunit beta [Verrucomicrobiales bacterium]
MKFHIRRDNFLEGLQQVQNVVGSRAALPILSNVLIEADNGEVRLTTTDLHLLVSGRVEADVKTPGATTLPVRKLSSIVKELPADEVTVTLSEGNVVSLRCGSSHFKLLGRTADEFPPPTKFDDVKEFKLDQRILKDGLKKTSYAISLDEMRQVLNGVYAVFKDNQLTLVATDGRRLAVADFDVEVPASQEAAVIIPSKCVYLLQSLLTDEGDLRIRIGQKEIAFELNRNLLVSKLVEGNYPNYRQVVPPPAKFRVTMEREPTLKALQRVALLAADKSTSIKLLFSQDNIEIMANAVDIGEAHESLTVKYNGPDMNIAFNPEFLMAPFRNLDVDEIFLDLIDEGSPGVLKINAPFLYVLMPMRVSQ